MEKDLEKLKSIEKKIDLLLNCKERRLSMKRLVSIALIALIFFLNPLQVSASAEESSVQIQATVASDGSCQILVNATIHKTTPGDLSFSIPLDAASVSLNGKAVRPKTTEDAPWFAFTLVWCFLCWCFPSSFPRSLTCCFWF